MYQRIVLFFLLMTFFTPVFAESFSLESSSLANDVAIPVDYTCEGKNISPALEWKNVPDKTQSFVLIFSDPDASGQTFYHWILYNIPANITKLDEGITTLPAGTQTGKNSAGETQYKGPCPPKGEQHRYIFTLYALNTTLAVDKNADANTILNAMQNHVTAAAEIKYMFKRA